MAAQAQPIAFALAPGGGDDIIDYSTAEGTKQYKRMTAPLKDDFDLTEKNLKLFLDQVSLRSLEGGWSRILLIPRRDAAGAPVQDGNGNVVTDDLLTTYAAIPMSRIDQHVNEYVNANAGAAGRNAQLSVQCAVCVKQSLTTEAQKRITLLAADYTVNGMMVGAKLIKILTTQARVDTQYSTNALHEKLKNTVEIMEQQGSDIKKFNNVINDTIDSLAARGEQPSTDLLSNLFKGYLSVADEEFVKYIKDKQADYDEAEFEPGAVRLTAPQLMAKAFNKYVQRVDKGLWNAPSAQAEEIIALKAEVEQLKAKSKAKPNLKPSPADKKKDDKEKGKSKGKGKEKEKKQTFPSWTLKAPSNNEPKEKKVNNKMFYWCPTHKRWVNHKPHECKLKLKLAAEATSGSPPSAGSPSDSGPELRLASAIQAVLQE